MARASRISNIDLGPIADAGVPITNFDAVNQTIDKAIDDRNQLRSDIEDLTRENTFKLEEEFRKYQEQAANNGDAVSGRVISACENVSQRMLQYNKKYRRGEVSRDQYLTAVNNMNRASVQIAQFVETADKFRLEAMARQEKLINEGTGLTEGSKLDAFLSDEFQQYKNLVNSNFYVASDGNMFFGKVDPKTGTMSKNPANFASVSTAITQPQNKYLNKDLDKYTTDLVEGIGTTIKGFSVGKYKTIEDAMQDPAVSKYIEDKWSSFTVNPENALSVITDQGVMPPSGGEWGFTYDATEADGNKDLILLKRNGGEGNRVTIETNHPNFQEGVKLAKERYTQEVAAKMKRKEVPREYSAPKPTAEEIKQGRLAEIRKDEMSRLKLFYSGSVADLESVRSQFKNRAIPGETNENQQAYVRDIIRDNDGIVILKEYITKDEDGRSVSRTARVPVPFGQQSEEQFVLGLFGALGGEGLSVRDYANLGLGTESNKFTTYKDDKGIGRVFGGGSVFEPEDVKSYDELQDVVLNNISLSPDRSLVEDASVEDVMKVVNGVGAAFTETLGSRNPINVTYKELGDDRKVNAITINYQGEQFVVAAPKDDLTSSQASNIQKLLRHLYSLAKDGKPITEANIKAASNLSSRKIEKKAGGASKFNP